jgi:hypothetical protein
MQTKSKQNCRVIFKSYLAVLPLPPSCDDKIASLAVFVIFLTYFF